MFGKADFSAAIGLEHGQVRVMIKARETNESRLIFFWVGRLDERSTLTPLVEVFSV
jgi:hypothetical protein